MENETKRIYREKSLERIQSPEQMNSYVRVVSPGVWVALAAIAVLLAGLIVWCSVITLEAGTVPAAVNVRNGELSLFVASEDRSALIAGTTLHIGEKDFILPEAEIGCRTLDGTADRPVMELLGVTEDACVYGIGFPCDLPDGVYEAAVVTEELRPLELLFN